VRLVAVPDDGIALLPGVFKSETMNNFADLGRAEKGGCRELDDAVT
jgi:hypothetical protein